MEQIRTTLFLPKSYHTQLKALAHQRNLSMAKLIQKALEENLFKSGQKTAKSLWGLVKNSKISEKEFRQAKIKTKKF